MRLTLLAGVSTARALGFGLVGLCRDGSRCLLGAGEGVGARYNLI